MAELRRDVIGGHWVIVAPERAARPMPAVNRPRTEPLEPADDPFAEGRELETPHETFAVRDAGTHPDQPGWRVRVVPNKFPAVRPDAPVAPPDVTPPAEGDGLYELAAAVGRHEVVVECPHGETDLARLPVSQVAEVLRAYRERMAAMSRDGRPGHALVFKNHGTAAGASLAHSHSQIIALPFVMPLVRRELDGAAAFHREHGRCVFAELLRRERIAGTRIVRESARFVALCPYAGRFPYETWIIPKASGSHFESADPDDLPELADVLRDMLARLADAADGPAYNYYLHSAPFGEEAPWYRWHIEVAPRIAGIAGFELGGGTFVNLVAPEVAAAALRQAGR
jgi:UDPglucose--hexose-1-phosphate uridylyltransferase